MCRWEIRRGIISCLANDPLDRAIPYLVNIDRSVKPSATILTSVYNARGVAVKETQHDLLEDRFLLS